MRHARAFLSVAALILAPSFAQATTIPYTSAAAFGAATTALTTITFEGLAPVNSTAYFPSPPGLTTSGVNFQALGPNQMSVIDPGYTSPVFFFPSGQFLQNNTFFAQEGILATLPGGTTAVGVDVSGFPLPFNMAAVVTTTGGTTSFSFAVAGQPTFSFVGFTSDVPILSLSLVNSGTGNPSAVTVDNFRFGASAAVPEPASLLLLGTGLAAAARYRGRRRQ